MRILRGLKLFTAGALCLLLLFSTGCAGKRPTDAAGQTGQGNAAAPEIDVETRLEKNAPDPAPDPAPDQDVQPERVAERVNPAVEGTGDLQSISNPAAKAATAENRQVSEASGDDASAPADDASDGGGNEDKGPADAGAQAQEAGAEPGQEKAEQEPVVLNFDNADLVEVIETFAKLLDINYLMDPGVGGSVTIQTEGRLSRSDLFPVFYQILQTNGLTAVKKGSLYRIVPIQDASRLPITANLNKKGQAPASGDQMIIQLVQLDAIAAGEMAKVLQPFVSSNGTMVTLEGANILMIVDQADNLEKILRMVDAFDTDIFQDVQYRFFPLDHADAESLSNILGQMFKSYGQAVASKINLIPIVRLNALLVITPKQAVLDEVADFVRQYDVPSTSTESGIFVYSVENGRADEITKILKEVFTGREAREADERDKTYRNPLARQARAEKQEAEAARESSENGSSGDRSPESGAGSGSADVTIGSGSLQDEVRITADEVRNNLIVEATRADYQVIKNLLKEIDILPRQVLIEVTIAEVTLDESSELGMEWSYLKGDENMSTSLLDATLGSSGLQYTIGKAERWTAAMKALASENKVNILSSPSILASNSESAQIDISTEVPVASSQYEYTSGENPVVSTSIEYRDTGVLLNVTPHINKNGIVTMEISQEVSEQAQSVQVGSLNYPSFFKRSADTVLTVKSGQSIVIGGLIRENRSGGTAGAPWLVNIPFLKYFFGRASDSYEKTELVILISPQVIASLDDVDAVTREFKEKAAAMRDNANEPD